MLDDDLFNGREIAQTLPQALLLKSTDGFFALNAVVFHWLHFLSTPHHRPIRVDELARAQQWDEGIAQDLRHFLSSPSPSQETGFVTVLPHQGHALHWRWLNARHLMIENVSKWHQKILHLQALSDTDLLTGLGNRRRFEKDFERVIAQVTRGVQKGATLVLFDFDEFKHVNDLWGHAKGDQVLANFGKLAQQCLRPYEFLTRIGGDEFAILTQHSGMQGALRVKEAIDRTLSAMPLPDGKLLRASFGFADIDLPASTASESCPDWRLVQDLIYARADADLYKMKSLKKSS